MPITGEYVPSQSAWVADQVAGHLTIKLVDKQTLLEMRSVSERLEKVFAHMEGESPQRPIRGLERSGVELGAPDLEPDGSHGPVMS